MGIFRVLDFFRFELNNLRFRYIKLSVVLDPIHEEIWILFQIRTINIRHSVMTMIRIRIQYTVYCSPFSPIKNKNHTSEWTKKEKIFFFPKVIPSRPLLEKVIYKRESWRYLREILKKNRYSHSSLMRWFLLKSCVYLFARVYWNRQFDFSQAIVYIRMRPESAIILRRWGVNFINDQHWSRNHLVLCPCFF